MNKWKLSTKLVAAFLIMAGVVLVVGLLGAISVIKLRSNIHEVGNIRLPSLVGLGEIADSLSSIDGMENTLLCNVTTPEQRADLYKEIELEWKLLRKGWAVYTPLPQTKEEAVEWTAFEKNFKEWEKNHETYIKLSQEFDALRAKGADPEEVSTAYNKAVQHMFTQNDPAMDGAKDHLAKVMSINDTIGRGFTAKSFSESTLALRLMIAFMGGGGAIAVGMGLFVAYAISNPIRQIVKQLSAGATETTQASGQVSSASQSLALGASEQAASLEETSSSLEEMSSMTKRNAENAGHAKELAQATRQSAEKAGTDIVTMGEAMTAVGRSSDQLRTAMDQIQASSSEISQILKTIDEIAFQTNILSLNAAVEAARAGEAGAGFAVVADEVRALAHRSAEAAKQTATMIKQASDSSHQGKVVTEKVATDMAAMSQSSEKVKRSLEEILAKARQVDEVIGEITTASHEQEQGISQVNMAVSQMDKVTQSNAASAEETASSAEELNAQAEELKSSIRRLQALVDGHRGVTDDVSILHAAIEKAQVARAPKIYQDNVKLKHTVTRGSQPKASSSIPLNSDFHDM